MRAVGSPKPCSRNSWGGRGRSCSRNTVSRNSGTPCVEFRLFRLAKRNFGEFRLCFGLFRLQDFEFRLQIREFRLRPARLHQYWQGCTNTGWVTQILAWLHKYWHGYTNTGMVAPTPHLFEAETKGRGGRTVLPGVKLAKFGQKHGGHHQ